MLSGNQRDRIAVLAEIAAAPNTFSERKKSYQHSFYDRAEISYVSGTEAMTGQMSAADKTMKFKVRFSLTRYNERQIILWRGDYYNIRSIDPDKHRTWLVLTADRAPVGTLIIVE